MQVSPGSGLCPRGEEDPQMFLLQGRFQQKRAVLQDLLHAQSSELQSRSKTGGLVTRQFFLCGSHQSEDSHAFPWAIAPCCRAFALPPFVYIHNCPWLMRARAEPAAQSTEFPIWTRQAFWELQVLLGVRKNTGYNWKSMNSLSSSQRPWAQHCHSHSLRK